MHVGGTIAGGHNSTPVTQHHKDFIKSHLNDLNGKLGIHATEYTVNEVKTQVVAGTNTTYHLTANDGKKYTATFFEPLPHTGEPTRLTNAAPGHN